MSMEIIENEALSMPESDRAALAQKLLASLGEPSVKETSELWVHEADRRAKEIDAGKVTLVSAEDAAKQVREIIG